MPATLLVPLADIKTDSGLQKVHFWQGVFRELEEWFWTSRKGQKRQKVTEREVYLLYSPGVERFIRFWSILVPQGK